MIYGSTKCAIEYAQNVPLMSGFSYFLEMTETMLHWQTGYWRRRDTISALS